MPVDDTNFVSQTGEVAVANVRGLWRSPTSGRQFMSSRRNVNEPILIEWQPDFSSVIDSSILISGPTAGSRPYGTTAQDGNIVHFAMSEGSMYDAEPITSGTRYMYLDDVTGEFRRMDGTVLGTISSVQAGTPIDITTLDLVYADDGTTIGRSFPESIEAHDGRVQIVMRARDEAGVMYYFTSRIVAGSWRHAFVAQHPSSTERGTLIRAADGDIDTLFVGVQSSLEWRADVYRHVTTDDGLTWGAKERMSSGGVPLGSACRWGPTGW